MSGTSASLVDEKFCCQRIPKNYFSKNGKMNTSKLSVTQQEPLPWASCPVNQNGTGYVTECAKSSPTQYFWYRSTLEITPSIDESGGIYGHLVAVLVVAWLIVALCVIKGIASAGKVSVSRCISLT